MLCAGGRGARHAARRHCARHIPVGERCAHARVGCHVVGLRLRLHRCVLAGHNKTIPQLFPFQVVAGTGAAPDSEPDFCEVKILAGFDSLAEPVAGRSPRLLLSTIENPKF